MSTISNSGSYKYDVSVVIINYNSKKYLDNLFDSLVKLKHDDFTFEIVLVDNASTDDSIAYFESKNWSKQIPVNVVKSKENRGFAGGNNFGVKAALGEYIVFLNNDTAVDELWLSELYHFIKNKKDCVIANSKLLFFYDFIQFNFKTTDKIELDRTISINGKEHYADGKFITNCLCEEKKLVCFGHTEVKLPLLDKEAEHTFVFKTITWNDETDAMVVNGKEYKATNGEVVVTLSKEDVLANRITLIQNAGSGIDDIYNGYDIGFCKEDGPEFEKEYEVNNGCGAAIIMKKERFDEVGGFDEQFFMYYEDTDLSYRMKGDSGKIYFCPTSIVRHIHTGSSTEWSPFFCYHVYRNKLLFLYKNYGKKLFMKWYRKMRYEAFRNRDANKRRGVKDAYKIAIKGMTGIHY